MGFVASVGSMGLVGVDGVRMGHASSQAVAGVGSAGNGWWVELIVVGMGVMVLGVKSEGCGVGGGEVLVLVNNSGPS